MYHLFSALRAATLVAMLLGLSVAQSHAATYTVTNTNDSGVGSLRYAIDLANANGDLDNIVFSLPTGTQTIIATNEWVISNPVNITGPGAGVLTLSGNNSSRVFNINTTSTYQVNISALTIAQGYSSGGSSSGGGIRVNGSNIDLNLTNCTLSQNVSTDSGGAIYNEGKTTINGCNFLSNSGNYGGAIGSQRELTINNSTFSNNSALGGGAIKSGNVGNNSNASLSLSNCSFMSNSASSSLLGGGAVLVNNHSSLSCLGSTFSGNQAVGALGGAILLGDGANDSFSATISGSTFSSNQARYGSAIHNYLGTETIFNCSFTGNSATYVGTVYNYGAGSTINVDRSNFSNNASTFGGGGIHNDINNTLNVTNSNFSSNSATLGGAIYNAATLTLSGSTFSQNQATSGGALYNSGPQYVGTINIKNCSLSQNSATSGGAIFNDQTAILTADSNTFSGNTANSNQGPTLYNYGASTLTNNIFKVDVSNTNFLNRVNSSIVSNGYNLSSDNGGGFLSAPSDLINTNPQLGPLQNNGGHTWTMALLTGSSAIDTGSTALTTDQRGLARPFGSADDRGAFEVQSPNTPPTVSVNITPTNPTTNVTLTANVVAADANNDPLTITYQWKKNGNNIVGQTSNKLNLSLAGNGDRGDKISVVATANDGTVSVSSESAQVTVANTGPSVTSISISPTNPTTNTILTANATGTDADGDAITFAYVWRKNGVEFTNEKGQTLDLSKPGNGDAGDQISVLVKARDYSAASAPVISAPVTVGQAARGTKAVSSGGKS